MKLGFGLINQRDINKYKTAVPVITHYLSRKPVGLEKLFPVLNLTALLLIETDSICSIFRTGAVKSTKRVVRAMDYAKLQHDEPRERGWEADDCYQCFKELFQLRYQECAVQL